MASRCQKDEARTMQHPGTSPGGTAASRSRAFLPCLAVASTLLRTSRLTTFLRWDTCSSSEVLEVLGAFEHDLVSVDLLCLASLSLFGYLCLRLGVARERYA